MEGASKGYEIFYFAEPSIFGGKNRFLILNVSGVSYGFEKFSNQHLFFSVDNSEAWKISSYMDFKKIRPIPINGKKARSLADEVVKNFSETSLSRTPFLTSKILNLLKEVSIED